MKDYYSILDLSPDASDRDIEQRYRAMVREYFSQGAPPPESQARMEDLTEAYCVLTDPDQRAAYDERLGLDTGSRRQGHGLYLGLDLGIARLSVGIGRVGETNSRDV